ncbi:MAG: class I SAM-dependent methyltransferase [Anaeromicrobium sp.]|jgi:SAM-dependent methyltransferase|uniref:class I SAM-dependent methyltransferase n=1 Tax=Anaeromicrobium sp. TaxID=1929132 RepID=UPI0025D7C3F3|nr:methyltransferase domain-containing protein [Anaeromicrobium sp.]MCT4595657.1 class I SAM-dependent methyltransferase [Anaeromicrobium sp.]
MSEYWQNRYKNKEMIWGTEPSKTAIGAKEIFQHQNIKDILIPGGGYGRNTKVFSDAQFKVDTIEISKEAIYLGKQWDERTNFIHGSVLDMPLTGKIYEGIYCYNLLHLFLEEDRKILIQKCYKQLKRDGLIFCTVLSEKDESLGRGHMIEYNTFKDEKGKIVHNFTQKDMRIHFEEFNILKIGEIQEKIMAPGVGERMCNLRYILARK